MSPGHAQRFWILDHQILTTQDFKGIFKLYIGKGMFRICLRNLPLALHESEARSTQTLHSTAPRLPDYPRPSEDSKMFKHATFHPSRLPVGHSLFSLGSSFFRWKLRLHFESPESAAHRKSFIRSGQKDHRKRLDGPGICKSCLARAQALLLFLCKRGRRIYVTLVYMYIMLYIRA